MKKEDLIFWVTNISNRNVSLSDLNLTIKAFSSVNLLDKKHYSYTLEQLNKSHINGSIYAKRDKIKKREVVPEINKRNILTVSEVPLPSREKSILDIKTKEYEELQTLETDKLAQEEAYAKEVADLADVNEPLKKV